MSLATLIATHASESAAAGNWAAVAEILNAPRQRVRETRAGYLEVLQALGESDFRHTIEVFSQDPIGKRGVAMLEDPDDSIAGLRFAHPATIGLIQAVAADLRPGVADKLLALGSTAYTYASEAELGTVTAEQCSDAWLVGSDCLLSVNRTGGTTRISFQVMRGGERVRLASLTEGQGSDADQALLTAVETAIDAWLLAGG